MSIEFQDGGVYTGWRAVPWILLFLPVILFWLLFGCVLLAVRWLTGRNRVLGFEYVGHGTWRRLATPLATDRHP